MVWNVNARIAFVVFDAFATFVDDFVYDRNIIPFIMMLASAVRRFLHAPVP